VPRVNVLSRILLATGPIGVVSAWLVIGAAWLVNDDWFVFTEHAFSDLGGPEARSPWIYNYGLIAAGALLSLFGLGVYMRAGSKLGAAAAAYIILAGVFLALIGVFPSGTRPHAFVSLWFFIQADLGLTLGGAAAYLEGRSIGVAAAILAALGFPLAGIIEALIGWPSVAVLEAYGVIVVDACILALTLAYWK